MTKVLTIAEWQQPKLVPLTAGERRRLTRLQTKAEKAA
jgi:hypothetical protein